MPEPTAVSTAVHAPAEHVWDLISDIGRMGEWSPETTHCRWLDGAEGPQVGARFVGTNAIPGQRWRTTCTVTESERGRVFAFMVRGAGLFPIATWRYDIAPAEDGCVVTETTEDLRAGVLRRLAQLVQRIPDRSTHNRAGMVETLRRLKAAAEATRQAG